MERGERRFRAVLTVDRALDLMTLADALLARLAEAPRHGLLALPPTIVTPRKEIFEWLRRVIAEKTGFAAGLRFVALKSFVTGNAEEGGRSRVLAKARIARRLLHIIRSGDGDPAIVHLDRWQKSAKTPKGRALRQVQFAEELGRLFEEYTLSRPEMLRDWETADRALDAEEAMQRALWRKVRTFGATADPTITEFAKTAAADAGGAHIFGFTTMSRGYIDVLESAARAAPIHLYLIAPPEKIGDGRAEWNIAQELVRRAAEIGATVRDHPMRAMPDGCLARLKRRRLLGETIDGPALPADGSIRIFSAPRPKREAEAVVADIWAAMLADRSERPLRFEDVMIAVPGELFPRYARLILAAMDAHHKMPAALRDEADLGGRFLEGVRLLFDLADGTFDRRSVTTFLRHPHVRARFPELEGAAIEEWLDATGVLFGIDAADHADTYVTGDLWNFDQGLRRLLESTFTDDDESGGDRRRAARIASSDMPALGAFTLVVRSLATDIRVLARGDAERPISEWFDTFGRWVRTYLDTDDVDAARRLFDAAGAAALEEDRSHAVGYHVALTLFLGITDDLEKGLSHRPTGGVRIAPLGTTDGTPCRRLYVVGLGEGDFPRTPAVGGFDLRPRAPLPGDITPRDLDMSALWSLIAATEDAVVLSYIGTDPVTGDVREASPIVAEIAASAGLAVADVRIDLPMRRHAATADDRIAPPSPGARRERAAAALRSTLLPAPDTDPRYARDAIRLRAPEAKVRDITAALGLAPIVAPKDTEESGERRVSIATLAAYLVSPLEAAVKFHLGLAEEAGDPPTVEPLAASALEETNVIRRAFLDALERGRHRPESVERAIHDFERDALWPTGPFGAAQHRRTIERIEHLDRSLQELGLEKSDLRPNVFGVPTQRDDRRRVFPPVRTVIRSGSSEKRITIDGTTAPASSDGLTMAVAVRGKIGAARVVRLFVEHAVIAAAGRAKAGRARFVVLPSDGEAPGEYEFDALDAATASAFLDRALLDLFFATNDFHLPFDAVKKVRDGEDPSAACRRILAAAKKSDRDDRRSVVRAAERFRFPTKAEADEVVRIRLGPLFDRLGEHL